MRSFLLSLLIASMFLCPTASRGTMIIRNYTPARNDRFYVGSDKNFVGQLYDFSGVGYSSSSHWATLVTDNCFISAYHYHPGTGETVTFRGTNVLTEPSFTYTVTGGTRIGGTDLWVGWFDKSVTVNSSIARYPVEMLPTANDYKGLILYNYGVSQRVGRNVLDDLYIASDGTSTGATAWYDYDNNDIPSVGGDETYLQGGDSGAPSFAVVNSNLALIGTHWAITSTPLYSVDTFVPEYYNDINAVVALRGQSVMAVPEPSIFWYLPLISGFLWLQRRRRNLA
jgi:hypothetical protein